MSRGVNVIVVSIQSNGSKKMLRFADWLFTTTFVPWDILWTMIITKQNLFTISRIMAWQNVCVVQYDCKSSMYP